MARPNRIGLDYWPMDVDYWNDPKFQFLRAKCGIKGEWICIRLLTAIYRNGYYISWSEDDQLLFAKNLNEGISFSQLNNVVTEAIKRNLFSEVMLRENSILTSHGIQSRYIKACSDSRRKIIEIDPKFSLLIHKPELLQSKPELNTSENTQREREREKEIEKEIEKENETNFSLTDFYNFLILEKIQNKECFEFLSSEIWFESKAMQLGAEIDIMTEKAKEFLIDLRDRDMIEGKTLIDLKSHFVSWFKKKRENVKLNNKPNYLIPKFSES